MKTITFKNLIMPLIITMLLFSGNVLKSQEIILIETGLDDDGLPTLYSAILGDTIEGGERAHPNATYRLTRGVIYPSEGLNFDFDITIDALDGEERPPMIVPFPDGNGSLPRALFTASATNTMVFKNILFSAINNPREKSIGKSGIKVLGGRTIVENCVFNGFVHSGIDGGTTTGYDVHVNNCIFRNIQDPSAWWQGDALFFFGSEGDSLVVTNSTFFNCGGHIVNSNWINYYTKYNEFSNNTVYGGNFCVVTSMSQTNSIINNNLFVNTFAMGIDKSGREAGWVTTDKGIACIVPVDTNDAGKMMNELGLVEADRNIQVHNNVYFWNQDVKDHWDSRGDQFDDTVALFMNQGVRAMFADNTSYPLFDETNNIELDPGMVDSEMELEVVAGFATYGTGIFDSFLPDGPKFEGYLHYYPGGDGVTDVEFNVEWPLAENLSYSNAALLTHATDGGAVGDPRWVDSGSSVNYTESSVIILTNYPNPFTEITTITFTLTESSNIKLSVFDIMGKEIKVLVDKTMPKGNHSIEWNGTNMSNNAVSSGIYFYQINNDSFTTTKKMIKIN